MTRTSKLQYSISINKLLPRFIDIRTRKPIGKYLKLAIEDTEGVDSELEGASRYGGSVMVAGLFTTEEVIANLEATMEKFLNNPTLGNKTTEQLKEMLTEAIQSENYELAAELQQRIKSIEEE